MLVYLITNIHNGKQYVGCTRSTIEDRWFGHQCDAKYGVKRALAKAIRKYGVDSFSKKLLEECASEEQMFEREKFWISKLNTQVLGYNQTEGGDNPPSTKGMRLGPRPLDIRQKISVGNMGKPKSPEARHKMSISAKKRPSNRLGKTFTPEQRKKISDGVKRRNKERMEQQWQ